MSQLRDAKGRFVKDAITIDMSQYDAFFAHLKAAGNGAFEKEIRIFLEGLAFEFLRIVQEEIIRMSIVDTRLMLASFSKGDQNNSWTVSEGGMRLDVSSTLDYAAYVNNGHWTNPKGVQTRFVPGEWKGDRFIYKPGANEGMILRQQWVEGYHYWEGALKIMEAMMPKMLQRKVDAWMVKYFSDFR